MAHQTWSTFTRKIYIKSPAETIYRHWATSRGIEKWFLRSCDFADENGIKRGMEELVQPKDTYRWYWHHWPKGEEGIVNEATGHNHLSFSFSGSEVSLTLNPEGEHTLVELMQHHIPTDDASKMNVYFGCGIGWTFWLTNLKAFLEHEVLLQHTLPDLMGKHDGFEFVNM